MLSQKCARMYIIVLGISLAFSSLARGDDWPQWLGPKRDSVWRETGIMAKFPEGGPRTLWRTPIGAGYAGPAVAGGKVVVTDRVLSEGTKNPASPFDKNTVEGSERVLCLDEATGKILWKREYVCPYQVSYGSGPRTTPVIAGDRVFTLGTMGDLYCLSMKDGSVIWSKKLTKAYDTQAPLWGFAGHPLLDGDRLICLVGGKGSVVVAFDKNTGKELWKALSAKEPGYAPPMIYDINGIRQLIIWHPESINSLNPQTGAVYWTQVYGKQRFVKAGMSIPTPRLDGDKLFLTGFYCGPLMLQVKGTDQPKIVWAGKGRSEQPADTDGLHSVFSSPFIKDGYIYGTCSYGELRCLKEDTGVRLWATYKATTGKSERWGNAFLVAQGDRFVLFNEQGDLILAHLTPKGYDEISRANILEPTNTMAGRHVVWSHPAFANRCVFARNDKEIVCVSLAAK